MKPRPHQGRHRPGALDQSRHDSPLPATSPWLVAAFRAYCRWYLARHFHSVRIASTDAIPLPGVGRPGEEIARVVYLNHASWWDPLVCLILHRYWLPGHPAFAPIDDTALRQYPFFRRLGFFGVQPETPRGAAVFLRNALQITAHPGNVLWLTPQGRFADARERPLMFRRGLGHLARHLQRRFADSDHRSPAVEFLPLAIEYTFWHERLPEVLIRRGSPLRIEPGLPEATADAWNDELQSRLQQTQDALAIESVRRNTTSFRSIVSGTTGVGGAYDAWRRLRCLLRGIPFRPGHGQL